jgi:nucleoside-diphosphate-sugar epimerase
LNGSIEFTTNNKAELIHNNALINLNMAEACRVNGVKRVFYSSSACVYPIHYQDTMDIHAMKETDDMPAHPDTEYGWEKLFSEHVYNSFRDDYGLEVRIARFFNIYGPEGVLDTLKSKAPMALTKKVIESDGEVYVWGDGTQKRSFCYIQDCVEAIQLLMESDVTEPVNIGTSDLVSIGDLVDLIADIEGKKITKVYQPEKVAGVQTRHADFSRAEELLGWKNKVGMREGMTEINKFAHKILKK